MLATASASGTSKITVGKVFIGLKRRAALAGTQRGPTGQPSTKSKIELHSPLRMLYRQDTAGSDFAHRVRAGYLVVCWFAIAEIPDGVRCALVPPLVPLSCVISGDARRVEPADLNASAGRAP